MLIKTCRNTKKHINFMNLNWMETDALMLNAEKAVQFFLLSVLFGVQVGIRYDYNTSRGMYWKNNPF